LEQFGARYYTHYTGTWNRPDPLGFRAGDPDLFRFVGNNPINITDPSGLAGPPVRGIQLDWDPGSPKWYENGNYEWKMGFKLGQNTQNGFIIQEVRVYYRFRGQLGSTLYRSGPYPKIDYKDSDQPTVGVYYEIFEVKEGKVYTTSKGNRQLIVGTHEDIFAFGTDPQIKVTTSLIPYVLLGRIYWDKGQQGKQGLEPTGGWADWWKDHYPGAGDLATRGDRPKGLLSTGLWRAVGQSWNTNPRPAFGGVYQTQMPVYGSNKSVIPVIPK
jgi:hypothetical protein